MTDTTTIIVALITAAGLASPGIVSAVLANRAVKLGEANKEKLVEVSHNVDGNLLEIKAQLAKVTAERLTLTQESSHALGMKEEKDKEHT